VPDRLRHSALKERVRTPRHHQLSPNDRIAAAVAAKRAALERFRRAATVCPVDPVVAASQAAASAAREVSKAASKRERIERLKVDKAAHAAQQKAQAVSDEAEALGAIERDKTLASNQKAARDLRYAARKARK
jgi:hypothetical protein